MIHSEHKYIDLGYRFEKADSMSPSLTKSIAADIRRLIESERLEDRAEARKLVEQGRKEARTQH